MSVGDMIERVARAMAEVIAPIVKLGPGRYSGLTQEDMLDAARAAILAMREPNEGMVRSGEAEMMARHPNVDSFRDPYVNSTYQAMIDKALEGGS